MIFLITMPNNNLYDYTSTITNRMPISFLLFVPLAEPYVSDDALQLPLLWNWRRRVVVRGRHWHHPCVPRRGEHLINYCSLVRFLKFDYQQYHGMTSPTGAGTSVYWIDFCIILYDYVIVWHHCPYNWGLDSWAGFTRNKNSWVLLYIAAYSSILLYQLCVSSCGLR